jgi:hypothetical protein
MNTIPGITIEKDDLGNERYILNFITLDVIIEDYWKKH